MDADIHQGNSEFRKLLEFSDLVKSASPDSQDVIDKTVNTIKSRLAAVNEARKQKVAELDKIKSQWYVHCLFCGVFMVDCVNLEKC